MSNYRFNLVPLDKVWYTISETKDLLSMSRTTIYKYINDGSLLVVHPNSSQRGVRVPATSIIRFAEAAEKRAREDALAKAGGR